VPLCEGDPLQPAWIAAAAGAGHLQTGKCLVSSTKPLVPNTVRRTGLHRHVWPTPESCQSPGAVAASSVVDIVSHVSKRGWDRCHDFGSVAAAAAYVGCLSPSCAPVTANQAWRRRDLYGAWEHQICWTARRRLTTPASPDSPLMLLLSLRRPLAGHLAVLTCGCCCCCCCCHRYPVPGLEMQSGCRLLCFQWYAALRDRKQPVPAVQGHPRPGPPAVTLKNSLAEAGQAQQGRLKRGGVPEGVIGQRWQPA